MKILVLFLFSIICDGFLLDTNTGQQSGSISDKRFNVLMTLYQDERESRIRLEKYVLQLQQNFSEMINIKASNINSSFAKIETASDQDQMKMDIVSLKSENKILTEKYNYLLEENKQLKNESVRLEQTLSSLQNAKIMIDSNSIAALMNKLKVIENELEVMQNQLNSVSDDVTARKQDFMTLYNNLQSSERKVQSLEMTINKSFSIVSVIEQSLRKNLSLVLGIEESLSQNISLAFEGINAVKQTLTVMKDRVALTACVTNTQNYGSGEVIPFKLTPPYTFTKGNVSMADGMFHCTVPGIYMITVFAQTNNAQGGGFYIYKNNAQIADAYITNAKPFQTGSVQVITRLRVNDIISVKAMGNTYVYSSYESCMSIMQISE